MRFVAELSVAETAKATGKTEGTIKKLQFFFGTGNWKDASGIGAGQGDLSAGADVGGEWRRQAKSE